MVLLILRVRVGSIDYGHKKLRWYNCSQVPSSVHRECFLHVSICGCVAQFLIGLLFFWETGYLSCRFDQFDIILAWDCVNEERKKRMVVIFIFIGHIFIFIYRI